jgi:TetR/AcrR family transcriptional repressor of nem operon
VDDVQRGRPRAFDADEALDEAMRLFWRRGYRGTTTRELEAALGINQSSIYSAFGSKGELLERALERYQGLLDEGLLTPLAEGPDGLAAVDGFLSGLSAWLVADGSRGCLIGRVMGEAGGPDPAAVARIDAYRGRLRGALTAALGRAASQGEIDAESIPSRVDLLVGMVLGLNLAVLSGRTPAEVTAIADGARAEVARWRSK